MASIEVREEDVKLLELLKRDKVLMPINVNFFGVKKGAALIACGDCDHFDDTWQHFKHLFKTARKPSRIFPVTRAGGAIWVPKSELLDRVSLPRDEDIFFDLGVATEKKEISTIFTSIHAPCGAAGLYGLSLFDQIELLVKSKERIKEKYSHIEGLEVKGFAPICYPGVRRRTYFVSAATWYEKQEQYREFDYTPGRLFSAAAG